MNQNLKMEQHYILEDIQFEEAFANGSLDPAIFTHEAHLRLAWIHVLKYGEIKAIENITEQLINFVNRLGVADKYNKTLTIAAIKAVKHFIQKKEIESFQDFISTYPRLKHNFKEVIGQHYSFNVFDSALAKKQYLAPDLLEFN